jgi:DNA polymerase-3 subunit chi
LAAEVWFYQLEQKPLPAALADLLERSAARGWRAVVRAAAPAQLEALDVALWTYRAESFLPHGVEGPDSARQPILLTAAAVNPNGARALFLVEGAAPEALEGYERVCLLFDGREEAALARARAQWKAVKAAGHAASYWQQNASGGWAKKA